jgi:hypothetical protein
MKEILIVEERNDEEMEEKGKDKGNIMLIKVSYNKYLNNSFIKDYKETIFIKVLRSSLRNIKVSLDNKGPVERLFNKETIKVHSSLLNERY